MRETARTILKGFTLWVRPLLFTVAPTAGLFFWLLSDARVMFDKPLYATLFLALFNLYLLGINFQGLSRFLSWYSLKNRHFDAHYSILLSFTVPLVCIVLTSALFMMNMGVQSGGQVIKDDFGTALYLTIVTFTTLGFGDVTPVPSARGLASIIAITGQVYFSVSLGLLVAYATLGWETYRKGLHDEETSRHSSGNRPGATKSSSRPSRRRR